MEFPAGHSNARKFTLSSVLSGYFYNFQEIDFFD